MGDIRAHLGSRISMHRKRMGMTQKALADRLKVDKATIWRIEKGDSWPTYDTMKRISEELRVDEEELMGVVSKEVQETGIPRDLLGKLLSADDVKLSLVRDLLDADADEDGDIFESQGDEFSSEKRKKGKRE